MARIGKIARLPDATRIELNKRLRDGQPAAVVLPWLNALPEVVAVLQEHFAAQPVSEQNLSDWRRGGFQDWLEKQDLHFQRMERTRELARMSAELAQASGGNLSEGAAAILGGQILEVLEGMASGASAEDLKPLILGVSALRAGDVDRQKLDLDRQKIAQKDAELALAREKFQRDTCELFLKWSLDKRAAEIAASPGTNTEKIAALGQLMFGEEWKERSDRSAQSPGSDRSPTPTP